MRLYGSSKDTVHLSSPPTLALRRLTQAADNVAMAVREFNGPASPLIQYLHNGLTAPDSLTTGPLWVPDNEGTLVSAGADRMAVPGLRLATTVEDGAVLGPELVTNGGFDTEDAWGTTSGWNISDGQAHANNAGSYLFQAGLVAAGKRYLVSFDVTAIAAGAVRAVFNGSPNQYWPAVNQAGKYSAELIVDPGTNSNFSLDGESFTGSIDNVSVREVIPTWRPTDTEGTALYPSQQVRTRQGTVTQYTGDYKGMMVQPARENLFTAPGAPVTQDITTTAQDYAVSVYGTGSVTLSGTATGTVNAGEELVVTATAGTLTVTVTGAPDHVQVEAGSFSTPPIGYGETAATTHTRAATVWQDPTASFLRTQGIALWGRFYPAAAGQTAHLLGCKTDSDNLLEVTLAETTVKLNKVVATVAAGPIVSYTHAKDTGMEYRALLTEHGMSLQVKQDEGAWSAWVDDTSDDAKAAAVIASTFQIGADGDGAGQVGGTFPFTASAFTPSFADLAAGKTWVETNTQWNVLGVSA